MNFWSIVEPDLVLIWIIAVMPCFLFFVFLTKKETFYNWKIELLLVIPESKNLKFKDFIYWSKWEARWKLDLPLVLLGTRQNHWWLCSSEDLASPARLMVSLCRHHHPKLYQILCTCLTVCFLFQVSPLRARTFLLIHCSALMAPGTLGACHECSLNE